MIGEGRTITKRDVAAVTLGPIVISNVYGKIRFGDMVVLLDGLRDMAGGMVGEMRGMRNVRRHDDMCLQSYRENGSR